LRAAKRAENTAAARRIISEPKKVRSPKLAHLIAEQLRTDIATGKIAPGDTLPSEAELLDQYAISRPTLREALRVLEAETLIQLGRGSRTGARVLGPSIKAIAQRSALYLAVEATTMGEVHEVRSLLEPPIVTVLASRRKKEFLRTLQECVERQSAALQASDYGAVLVAINDYHDLLIGLSDNKALNLLAGILHQIASRLHPHILAVGDRRNQRQMFAKRVAGSVEAYRELTRLIAAGKPAEAEKKWRSHMDNVARYLVESGIAKLRVSMLTPG
jgi:GntR family transcriptional regulator, transcriptional repressor for pyruvate dehydrogenase complex